MHKIFPFITCIIFSATVFSQAGNFPDYYMGYDTVVTNQWNGTAWTPYRREMYSNNAQCVTTSILTQNWVSASSAWVNSSLRTITYTQDNQVTLDASDSWLQTPGSWIQAGRFTISHNAANLPDSMLGESWLNGSWQKFLLYTYTYNSDQTVNQLVQQFYTAMALSRSTYSYPNNSTYQLLSESWNNNSWTNTGRSTVHYLGQKDKTTSILTENWVSNQWVTSSLQTTTYDNNNHRINTLNQTWNSTAQNYVNSSQVNYVNDATGKVIQQVNQQWNTGTNTWLNQMQTNYTYKCNVLLPLTLTDFKASKNSNNTLLTWQTANEINSDYFIIQRSVNGANFTDIGSVNAQGQNSTVSDYRYIDNTDALKSGIVYYRLRITDKNGRAVNSKIVAIVIDNKNIQFDIKPNPAHNSFTIITDAPKSTVTVAHLSGQVLLKQNINTAGEHQLNIASFARGVYIVNIFTTQGVINRKLVIE